MLTYSVLIQCVFLCVFVYTQEHTLDVSADIQECGAITKEGVRYFEEEILNLSLIVLVKLELKLYLVMCIIFVCDKYFWS